MSDIRYGIVQGRLVESESGELQCFPQKKWRDEFRLAKESGLDFITSSRASAQCIQSYGVAVAEKRS